MISNYFVPLFIKKKCESQPMKFQVNLEPITLSRIISHFVIVLIPYPNLKITR